MRTATSGPYRAAHPADIESRGRFRIRAGANKRTDIIKRQSGLGGSDVTEAREYDDAPRRDVDQVPARSDRPDTLQTGQK